MNRPPNHELLDSAHVLYLDNHLLVVDKPPGLLTQGDRTGDASLVELGKVFLKTRFDKPGRVYLGLVHRLDRPASGVLVLARTSKAARRLTQQFKQGRPEKRYLALVEGAHAGHGAAVDHLVKERRQVRVVPRGYPGAKRAALDWRVVAARAGRSLVDVRLHTGRAHQIRVQLAHRGMSLVGDLRYGARQPFDGRNLALHSYRLTVEHPTRRAPVTWQAAPPAAWQGFFDAEIETLLARSSEAERPRSDL